MTVLYRSLFLVVMTGIMFSNIPQQQAWAIDEEKVQIDQASFDLWLEGLRTEAAQKGVSASTLDKALTGLQPVPRVIELDRRQPEFSQTFWKYLTTRVNSTRIQRGRALLQKHADLLARVEKRFGVQPRFLVAFWGLESNFGDYTGVFPALGAIATLAHDPRRSDFFRDQLMAALGLVDGGHVAPDIKASWAGAMGQTQFIPTTYRDFALDFDGDNKRDLWGSLPDIFASSANYLARSGWQGDRTWGREVKIPKDLDLDLVGLSVKKKLADWQKLGVRRIDGRNLPTVDVEASLVLPSGYNGPAFLVYQNYRSILIWNRSTLYAIAVGHLADRLAGGPELQSPRTAETALSRNDVIFIQNKLTDLGFDTGGADGIVGSNTRKAIKDFQKSVNLPADGFPSAGFLERLRGIKAK